MEAIIRPIYRMFPGWKDTLMDAASVKKFSTLIIAYRREKIKRM